MTSNTDYIAAARDVLHSLSVEELSHMLYEVRADHQHACHAGSEAEQARTLEVLQMYERRAELLGVHHATN